MINLSELKSKLAQSQNLDDFMQRIENKDFYKSSFVGYIDAASNEMYAKAPPGTGGSGGACYKTWSVKKSIGRGYGKQLYDVLLGWAAIQDIYITPDRFSVSGKKTGKAASGRWSTIDGETSDEVPPKDSTYLGTFDDYSDTKTLPRDDDCAVYDQEHLDKGYKNSEKIEYYNILKNNLEEFFSTDIETLFEEPGFFGKMFGNTPENKAQKIKDKLLKVGQDRFADFMLGGV